MKIVTKNVNDLIPAHYNPRKKLKPGDKEYDKLKRSIETFGYVEPIIWNKRTNTVVGGHQRLTVLKDLGHKTVDVVEVDLDLNNEKALNVALNKVSGEWDAEKLEDLLRELDNDTDLDVTLTGFDLDELETLYSGSAEVLNEADDEIKESIKKNRKEKAGGLLKKCGGFAPFSVLDASSKNWQNRKKQWLSMGIKSEVGRDAVVLTRAAKFFDDMGVDKKYQNYTSIFDPVLCEICYKWFCPQGGVIFDPFAGGSVRGIVASELGYKYTGIELRNEQVEANRDNYEEIQLNPEYSLCDTKADYDVTDPIWICDDSRNMNKHVENGFADLVFTCPPYADLEKYSDDERDLSNKEYSEFIRLYKDILVKASNKLKNNRFLVIVVGEVRDKNGIYYNFVGDTIRILSEDCGLKYYNEMILMTPTGTIQLTCGLSFNKYRKIGKRHQNILVFFKGDPKTIIDDFGPVVKDEDIKKEVGDTEGGDT